MSVVRCIERGGAARTEDANGSGLRLPARYGQNDWEIVLGRRNWLFAGSERAGCRAAAIQSLLATAKLNGLEPYAWLKDTLEKLPEWPNGRIDELLPLRASARSALVWHEGATVDRPPQ